MKDSTSKILKYSLSGLLAVGLLCLCFRGVDWNNLLNVLKSCGWAMVLLSMLVGFLSCVVRALRWRLLLRPLDGKVEGSACIDGVCIGRLTNLAVQHLGEFVRCGVVSRRGTPYDKVLGTVVVERAWDLFMLFVMLIVTGLTSMDTAGVFFRDKVFGPIASRLSLNLWALGAAVLAICAVALWLIVRFRDRNALCARLCGFVSGTVDGMKSVLSMKGKGIFIVLTMLLWGCFLMMSWLIIKALPVDYGLNMADALFLMLVGTVAGLVPVPGGFGAFHYVVALALSSIYDIPWETGIIFATLSHESQTLMILVSGSACLLNEFISGSARQDSGRNP